MQQLQDRHMYFANHLSIYRKNGMRIPPSLYVERLSVGTWIEAEIKLFQ